jgi:hypothetical protein
MKKIGEGTSAEIFLLENNEILKLFYYYDGVAEWAEREIERHRLIEGTDLPVARIKTTTFLEGRPGIIFENHGEGKSLEEAVWRQPVLFFRYARLFGELLAKIHSTPAPDLPSQRTTMVERIENASGISEKLKDVALENLHKLPEGSWLCHGDFHLGNIITDTKKIWIIDWNGAVAGEPAMDAACSFLVLKLLSKNQKYSGPLMRIRSIFTNVAMKHYQTIHKITQEEIKQWEIPAALFLGLNHPCTNHQKELFLYAERGCNNENH